MKELEALIVGSFVHNPDFFDRVVSKVQPGLFESEDAKTVFSIVKDYNEKYKKLPSHDESLVELKGRKGLSQDTVNASSEFLRKIWQDGTVAKMQSLSMDWLLDKTKKYLTERACYNVIMESLGILDESDKTKGKKSPDAIPEMFANALSIDFDESIGHDYFDDVESRYDFYTRVEECIPFSLSMMNKVLGGRGMPRRSMAVGLSSTGVGKSLFMSDQAAFHVMHGRNVLYISLEMAAEKIAERVDAKLLGINIWELKKLPKDVFLSRVNELKKKTTGKIIIEAYAPGTYHSNNLRTTLNELKKKQGFVPDVICIDYLGLMSSYRMKVDTGSYGYLKAVSEELRGVAMDYNAVCLTAMQLNRGGMNNADPELDAVADSVGISHTADLIWVMTTTPELEQVGMFRFKLLKNRNGSMTSPNSWVVGIDRSKMTLYDADVPNEPVVGGQSTSKVVEPKNKLKFS
jgi:replicative DNA helicase